MTLDHPSAQDWIPRDDMATLMRMSPDTVRRDYEKHDFETREDETGRVLVKVGDFLAIGRIRTEDLTAGEG